MSPPTLFAMPEPEPEGWSVNRLAKELRLDRRTVEKRLAGVEPTGNGPSGPVWLLADAARACFEAQTLSGLEDLQRRKLEAQTTAAELDVARKRGELIDAGEVRRAAAVNGRVEREAWTNWPARVGPLLAAEIGVDPVTFTAALERHVRTHMEERANADIGPGDLPAELG